MTVGRLRQILVHRRAEGLRCAFDCVRNAATVAGLHPAVDADDAISEVLVELAEAPTRLLRRAPPSADAAAWLLGAVRVHMRRMVRARSRMRSACGALEFRTDEPQDRSAQGNAARASLSLLRDARWSMTRRQRRAIELRARGLSYVLIGSRLGIRRESAWQLVQRAIAVARQREDPRPVSPNLPRVAVAALPKRSRDVYRLYRSGCSRAAIARALSVSPATVRDHVRLIRRSAQVISGSGVRRCPPPPGSRTRGDLGWR